MRSRLISGSVLLVLVLAVVSTCRQKSTSVSTDPTNGANTPATATAPGNAANAQGFNGSSATHATSQSGPVPQPTARRATEQRPQTRTAQLTAEDPAAQINVRSQPSSTSDAIGYGRVGEAVVLGRAEADADGYTWYQVTFQRDEMSGWVREDLLDLPTLEPVAATEVTDNTVAAKQPPSDTLKTALDETCGSQRAIEAYYVTPSNTIYICKVRNQRTFLSQETGTEPVVTTQEVESLGGGYIITNGNFEYRLDSGSFVVVRFDDSGQQEEILRENIVYTERY